MYREDIEDVIAANGEALIWTSGDMTRPLRGVMQRLGSRRIAGTGWDVSLMPEDADYASILFTAQPGFVPETGDTLADLLGAQWRIDQTLPVIMDGALTGWRVLCRGRQRMGGRT